MSDISTADVLYGAPAASPPVQAPPATPALMATTPSQQAPVATAPAYQPAVNTTTTPQSPDEAYRLALPQDSVIEAGALQRTEAWARAEGLSPETAQRALEYADSEVSSYRVRLDDDWRQLTRESWPAEARADSEIGGAKFTGAVTEAKMFLSLCGDDEVRKFLDDTGFGNHKLVIRMFSRAMSKMQAPSGRTASSKSNAEVFYGKKA